MGLEPDTAVKIAEALLWVAKKLPGVGLPAVRAVKRHVLMHHFRQIHDPILHTTRRLCAAMSRYPRNDEMCGCLAVDLCTEYVAQMRSLLLLGDNDLHCCLKMLTEVPAEKPGEPPVTVIRTFARSKPLDDRRERAPSQLTCGCSTVFAALTGGDDGRNRWRPMSCFCCNDLRKAGDNFCSSRSGWQTFYKSVLVLPLRYVRNPDSDDFDTIGFLAFDSPRPAVFTGLPDVFQFRNDPGGYRDRLNTCTAFHLGAIFADSLSAHLHGVYSKGTSDGQNITITTDKRGLEEAKHGIGSAIDRASRGVGAERQPEENGPAVPEPN